MHSETSSQSLILDSNYILFSKALSLWLCSCSIYKVSPSIPHLLTPSLLLSHNMLCLLLPAVDASSGQADGTSDATTSYTLVYSAVACQAEAPFLSAATWFSWCKGWFYKKIIWVYLEVPLGSPLITKILIIRKLIGNIIQ